MKNKFIVAVIVAAIIVGLFTFVAGFIAGSISSNDGCASIVTTIKDVFPPITAVFLLGYLASAILDICSGIIKSFIMENFSSGEMRKGLWKKAATVGIISITAIIDIILFALGMKFSQILTIGVSVWFIAMEAFSIAENAGECGVPVPKILKKALLVLKNKYGDEEKNTDKGK